MQKIAPCLWFDGQAEEAAKFYTSVFKNSRIGDISYYPEGAPGAAGTVLTVEFQVEGQDFIALNGGPEFKFNEALSLSIACETQQEIDELWTKLTAEGGEESMCGWLKDKFGVSWQINPPILTEMIKDKDRARAKRVMDVMLQMKKLDIAELQRAYEKP